MMPVPLAFSFFIEEATRDPLYFASVVGTVVVSVVLHELGHGWAAMRQGDPTPRLAGHWTLDPLKHMGPVSLVMLLLVGIAWGSTPVDPRRFRSRHGDAWVSLAGPLVNLLLALLALTALGVWLRVGGAAPSAVVGNARSVLFVFGTMNVVLLVFNLVPIPPLDGSSVLASFVRPYRRLVHDPNNRGLWLVAFIGVFYGAGFLFEFAGNVADAWLGLLVS